jgi:hypothetical protein
VLHLLGSAACNTALQLSRYSALVPLTPQPDEQLLERLSWLQGRGFKLGDATALWLVRFATDCPRALALALDHAELKFEPECV